MKIEELENSDYQKFISEAEPISFLQNYEWGEVEKGLNKEIFRWGIFMENKLIAVIQIIGQRAKRGNFLVIPHGPIICKEINNNYSEIIKAIIKKIFEFRLNKKYSFLRANFLIEREEGILKELLKIGFKIAPRWFVSENFWIKELNKSQDELLSEMSEHHRKEILLAKEKEYLIIEKSDDIEKIDIFWQIYAQLAKEKGFVPYSYELIRKEFEIFSKFNQASWYLGKVENKYYSVALIIFNEWSAYYHHSASIKIKEPLNYKLQWQIILDAKERGCKFYNFWGITDKGPEHPWYGLTQFKKGFGGREIKLLPTLDYVFNLKYYLTYFYEKYLK
ncbi:MAG: peptidoglycan bridge formation glycyltransferase FemA/FemB family protein [Patescibacteria group bacterium]|nr:peptidoglycan bridge formation glycyltransferase FemA/FemB family protein [Patescibacteria group bacterium]